MQKRCKRRDYKENARPEPRKFFYILRPEEKPENGGRIVCTEDKYAGESQKGKMKIPFRAWLSSLLADAAPAKPKCCLYHHRGFASLTGGLQAADQAQNAETSATTVQLVSVCFSVFIAVLLTYAGSIWQLSIATVLMYQAAWSALSIAVCALKQHS